MAFPASPVPSYYATVTLPVRNGIFYQQDLQTSAPVTTVVWKIGSVPIRSGH